MDVQEKKSEKPKPASKKAKSGSSQRKKPTDRPSNDPARKDAKQSTKLIKQANKENQQKLKGMDVNPLSNYLKTLGDPFKCPATKSPVNYNPVPSIISSVATTSHLMDFTVAAGMARELVLFPGHNMLILDDDARDNMDAVSYHASYLNVAGTSYNVGPIGTNTVALNTIGVLGLDTSPTAYVPLNNTSTVGILPIPNATPLPYTGFEGKGSHSRWKLNSMGLRIVNTTPELYRGGNVQTVQPTSQGVPAAFSNLALNPTFKIWDTVKPIQVSWIPRLQDLAYWHTDSTSTGAATVLTSEAALRALFIAPGSITQSYQIEVICHWELAGTNLLAIGSPSIHMPADRNVVEPVVEVHANSGPSMSGALQTAKSVIVKQIGQNKGLFADLISKAENIF